MMFATIEFGYGQSKPIGTNVKWAVLELTVREKLVSELRAHLKEVLVVINLETTAVDPEGEEMKAATVKKQAIRSVLEPLKHPDKVAFGFMDGNNVIPLNISTKTYACEDLRNNNKYKLCIIARDNLEDKPSDKWIPTSLA